MIREIASWALGGMVAAPCHIASGFTMTALSEGVKHLTKQLESKEVTEMEHTGVGIGPMDPLNAMMNECLSMARGLYGISRSMHDGGNPSLTESQESELREIESRLERLMGGRRWRSRWHRRCCS